MSLDELRYRRLFELARSSEQVDEVLSQAEGEGWHRPSSIHVDADARRYELEHGLIEGMTLAEWRDCSWWPNGSEARIYPGSPGHDREIVVNIDGYDWSNYIPDAVADVFHALLPPEWFSQNRGSRLEVHPSGHFAGGFDPETDPPIVSNVLEQMGLVVYSD